MRTSLIRNIERGESPHSVNNGEGVIVSAAAADIAAIQESIVHRTMDATRFNAIANHPNVRPWLGGTGEIDLAAVIGNVANVALETAAGGFLLVQHDTGLYEVHSLFHPDKKRNSVSAMRAGLDFMFTRTNCEKIVTQVPDDNRPAAALARLANFREMFRREGAIRGPTSFWGLSIDEWIMGNSGLEEDGERFHAVLEKSKVAHSSDLTAHPHDPAHERAVGGAVRMIAAGNPVKGVTIYNRWARVAGYAPVSLISLNPIVIDAVDAVVMLADGAIEVLLCR